MRLEPTAIAYGRSGISPHQGWGEFRTRGDRTPRAPDTRPRSRVRRVLCALRHKVLVTRQSREPARSHSMGVACGTRPRTVGRVVVWWPTPPGSVARREEIGQCDGARRAPERLMGLKRGSLRDSWGRSRATGTPGFECSLARKHKSNRPGRQQHRSEGKAAPLPARGRRTATAASRRH